jgi:hypothetical protein
MMGVEPSDLTFYEFFEATHPEDIKRNSLGRSTLLKLANDLFVAGKEKGCKLLSSNLRIKNAKGDYSNLLMQMYLCYSKSLISQFSFLKSIRKLTGVKR